LTGFGTQIRLDRRAKAGLAQPRVLRAVTILCLVLLSLFAVVQVAHVHSDATAADHCPLCISMHSAAPVVAAAAAVLLVQVGTPVRLAEKRAAVRNWNPKLYTRPPPAGC